MSKKTKIWLIAAACLVLLGCFVFAGVMGKIGWDFTKLSTEKYQANTHQIGQEFDKISIDTQTADVVFMRTEEACAKAVCYEQEKVKHSVSVESGTLKITVKDLRRWYEKIAVISFSSPKITVYLPQETYGSVDIKTDAGDVQMPKAFSFGNTTISTQTGDVDWYAAQCESLSISAATGDITISSAFCVKQLKTKTDTGDIRLSSVNSEGRIEVISDTGKVHLLDVSCDQALAETDTGDIVFQNTRVNEELSAQSDTGDVRFDFSDAQTIQVTTDTGDVQGTLNSPKVFIPRTSTGRIDVPQTTSGGVCEITTDTGDISIKIA